MRKKIIISLLLLILTILLSSCSTTQQYTSQKDLPDNEYHKGTQGLHMQFLEEAPPYKIYQNDGLDIMIEYANKGAYDIRGGKIYLSGFDTSYISPSPSMIPNLEADGKSIFNPEGKITQTATFSENSVRIPLDADKITQIIKATACYEYQTQASVEVCINPKTRAIRNDICEVSTISLSGGQGAPVAVTKIEEEIYQNKLQFRIYFENAGIGTVMRPGSINNCHTSLQREDANKIEVRRVAFSGRTMRCEPQNPIQLDERGKGFVFCYYQGDLGDEAYKTLLNIELDYGYRNSIQQDIEILKAP